jgi:hypothetical protein
MLTPLKTRLAVVSTWRIHGQIVEPQQLAKHFITHHIKTADALNGGVICI